MNSPIVTDPVAQIQDLSVDTQKQVAIEAMRQLGAADQKDVVKQAGLPGPGQAVADKLWLMIVASFALVMIGSFMSLAIPVLMQSPKQPEQILLTVFTTVAAFLTGILTPSPVSRNS